MLKIFFSALYIYAIAGVIYNMYSKDLQWLFEPNNAKAWNKKAVASSIVNILSRVVVAIVLWPILAHTNYSERKAKVHG